MDREAFLGIDVGGTGAKAAVFDAHGLVLGHAGRGYAPTPTEQGGAEIPIAEIESAARECARAAIAQAGARVRALCVVTQGQTFVSLDRQDRPLHPAIIWYDSRAGEEAEHIRREVEKGEPDAPRPTVQAISSGPKILWLRRRDPERMAGAVRHLLLPDYFSYRLTGRAVSDPCTAGSSGLYPGPGPGYHARALAAAGVDASALAAVQEPGTPIGKVLKDAAADWSLPADALLVTGTNDQFAGALGAGVCREGLLSSATGTCLSLVTLTRRALTGLPPGLFGGRFPIPGYHYALAYAKTAGVVLDWFRRTLAPSLTLAELDRLGAQSPPGSRGLSALPHFDGMVSPTPDAAFRGLFAGIGLHHSLGDLYRALMESLAFSLKENIALLGINGLPIERIRSIGGGARSDFWLQLEADVTGLPVDRPRAAEAATLGAAMLAALGAGAFHSLAESCAALYGTARVFEPAPEERPAYAAAYTRYQQWCDRVRSTQGAV